MRGQQLSTIKNNYSEGKNYAKNATFLNYVSRMFRLSFDDGSITNN